MVVEVAHTEYRAHLEDDHGLDQSETGRALPCIPHRYPKFGNLEVQWSKGVSSMISSCLIQRYSSSKQKSDSGQISGLFADPKPLMVRIAKVSFADHAK
jgi:hypothetical protein